VRVLIALDAGPECGEIVNHIASRPWPSNTSFLLLHVLDPFPFTKEPILLKRAREGSEAKLKEAGQALCGGGWAMEEQVILGRARRDVAKAARDWKADLVVVGSSGAGALTRLFLGSTARSVLNHAPCSVEIVRLARNEEERAKKAMKVLVATDGSEHSIAALRSLANRPWAEGSTFHVISIAHPSLPLVSPPADELKDALAIKNAKRHAESGAAILSWAGLDADSDAPLAHQSDGREIVKQAEQCHAQMIVLGSHGRRGLDRLMLGSVSEHVALHAPCSVEVIRGLAPAKKKSKRKR